MPVEGPLHAPREPHRTIVLARRRRSRQTRLCMPSPKRRVLHFGQRHPGPSMDRR